MKAFELNITKVEKYAKDLQRDAMKDNEDLVAEDKRLNDEIKSLYEASARSTVGIDKFKGQMQEMKTEYDQKIKDMTKNLGAMVQSGAAAGDGDGGGGGGGGKVQFLPPPEPEVTLKKLEAVAAKLEKQFNEIIKDEIKPKLSRLSDSIKELEKADEKL